MNCRSQDLLACPAIFKNDPFDQSGGAADRTRSDDTLNSVQPAILFQKEVRSYAMGKIRTPLPVKLFIGMLSPDASLFSTCRDILTREYGPLDLESDVLPWSNTEYYQEEMGPGIVRKFIFFAHTIDPMQLPGIKAMTNAVEESLMVDKGGRCRRSINLDPGYVTEAKVVLATTKDFSHRLYIGTGVYAEVTLRYSLAARTFTPFDHTYPDYRSEEYLSLFNNARSVLRSALQRTR